MNRPTADDDCSRPRRWGADGSDQGGDDLSPGCEHLNDVGGFPAYACTDALADDPPAGPWLAYSYVDADDPRECLRVSANLPS